MKYILSFLLIFCASLSYSQNHNSVWCFGDSAGIDFNNITNPLTFQTAIDGRGSCVSYSNSFGNLIIYGATIPDYVPNTTLAARLFNAQHLPIQDADSITGTSWYNELTLFPKPGDSSKNQFYLFSNSVGTAPNKGMYYTLIDMSLNSGLGGVLQENIQIDTNYYGDCITSIKHGNGRDWWVISKWSTFSLIKTNRFFLYRVTPDSIYGPDIQDLGNAMDYDFQKIVWHPSGNKFMLINVTGFMGEYDFNRCTGLISINRIIFPDLTTGLARPFWGGGYSSNGNVFYVSRTSYGGNSGDYNYLLQYDLTAANIPSSCDTLDSTMYPPVDCGDLRLAPDGKIYYSQAYISQSVLSYPYADSMYNYINMNLGVINYPDSVGAACDFQPFSFYLGGKRTYYGLPNNPNYSLGKLVGSTCDTIQYAGITSQPPIGGVATLQTTYISEWQKIFVNAQNIKGKNCVLKIFDVNGREVYSERKNSPSGAGGSSGYFTQDVDVSSFASGMYLVNLITEKEMLSAKFVKEK